MKVREFINCLNDDIKMLKVCDYDRLRTYRIGDEYNRDSFNKPVIISKIEYCKDASGGFMYFFLVDSAGDVISILPAYNCVPLY